MAQAPRRRGRSGGRSDGRRGGSGAGRGDGPRKARPAKPAAAKPVRPAAKPPAAQPVRPVAQPPAAKPVRPAAKPPAAKPVAPKAAPVARPAATPAAKPAAKAKPPAGKSAARRSRMAEEEVGGRRAAARGGRGGGGGLGLGAKVLLATALPAFIVMLAMAFLPSQEDESAAANIDEVGYRVVATLSSVERSAWFGGKKSNGFKDFVKNLKDLYGGEGSALIDKMDEYFNQDPGALSEFERSELIKEKQNFERAKEALGKSDGASDLGKSIQGRLSRAADTDRYVEGTGLQIMAIWAQKGGRGKPGDLIATSTPAYKSIGLANAEWTASGQKARTKSTITTKQGTFPVHVYASALDGTKGTIFAAIYSSGESGSGGGINPIAIVLALLGAGVVAVCGSMVAGGHGKGVKSLAREIDRLGTSGDPTRQIRAQGAEATQLARSVERMVGNLEFRQQHDGSDLEEIVSREQKIASEIHKGLMAKNPPRLAGWEVETLFKPGFEIGGDHFEYFPIDEDHLGVILLDTNVRGVQAAVLMAAAKAYVRAAAPGTLSPAAVLKEVNRHLAGELPPGRHVTALYAVIDTTEGRATLASAGHLPLIVYRHGTGKVFKVNPEGIAMGLDKGPVFDSSLEEGDIEIGIGDRIVLYTDGGLKIQNSEGEEFGEARFYQSIAREAPKNSSAFVNFVGSSIDQFQLDAQQNDDITISTVKRLK